MASRVLFALLTLLLLSSTTFSSSAKVAASNTGLSAYSSNQALIPTRNAPFAVGGTIADWFAQKMSGYPPWNVIGPPIPYLASKGFNWLRVGVTTHSTPELESYALGLSPSPPPWGDNMWSSREYALGLLKAGANAGMRLDLFFFLSDHAAGGGNQKAPPEWANYSLTQTADALRNSTYNTTMYYIGKGLKIDLYEVGNEIEFGVCGYSIDTRISSNGIDVLNNFSWDEAHVWSYEAVLLEASIAGIKAADPAAKIDLHISTFDYPLLVDAFFKAMNSLGVKYDYGSLSYYPWGVGTHPNPNEPDDAVALAKSIGAIASAGKLALISEYSYPSSQPDPSIVGPVQIVPGYPFTLAGQDAWVRNFVRTMARNPAVAGVIYFYPDDYLLSGLAPAALFVDDTQPKPALLGFATFHDPALPLALQPGWNLMSLPLIPYDSTITSVLSSQIAANEVVSVWSYTGAPRIWESYVPGKPSTLTTMTDGNGYWICMRSNDTLYVFGNVIAPASAPSSYSLLVGWNLVGFKPQPNASVTEQVGVYLSSITGSYDTRNVWVYDSTDGQWILADSTYDLGPGQAMWILVTSSTGATLRP